MNLRKLGIFGLISLLSYTAMVVFFTSCVPRLYPSWDAQNMNSVHLAEKLGYEFDHEYTAYEVSDEERTH